MFYILAAGVVAAGVFVLFLPVCLPADVPDGSPSGFPTEVAGCFLFGFCRYSS